MNIKDFLNFQFYAKGALEARNTGINYLGSCRPDSYNKIDFLIDAEAYYK